MSNTNITAAAPALTREEIEGGWATHPVTSVNYYSKPRAVWGYHLTDANGFEFFMGFKRKCDAVEAGPFLAEWDGKGDAEMAIESAGFAPEGYKGTV